jgi:hypothetical protein
MELHRIWIEQCEAAKSTEPEFGTQKANPCLLRPLALLDEARILFN